MVAETLAQARDAAELVEVDYEMLPAVTAVEDAVKDGAPTVWDECPGNVSFTLMFGNKEATDAAFAKAAHVVSLRLENNRVSPAAMEPRVAIGDYRAADDAYTLYTTSQNPHGNRTTLAGAVFKIPETKLRVISPDVGGGFGMKFGAYPGGRARAVGLAPLRPAGEMDRDALGGLPQRQPRPRPGRAGRDGARRGTARSSASARSASTPWAPISSAPAMVRAAVCAAPHARRLRFSRRHIVEKAVFTNTTPLAPYRGAGRPEATYLIERLIDRAARVIGLDPAEIRRRNYIAPAKMPYKTPTGTTYDSGDFARVMDECLKLADWNGFAARRRLEEGGKLRGRGLAYFIEEAAVFNERMDLRFDPSGTVTILAGTHSHGQGHATAFAQLVSEWLGVPFESIRYVQGDTDAVPIGRGTYGSRSSMVGGNALKKAADAIIDKAKGMAAHLMEAAPADVEFKDGQFRIAGTDRAIPLTEVAKAFYRPMFLAAAVRRRAGGVGLVCERAAELSQRLPYLRGGDRSGERRGRNRALHGRRRRRPRAQPSPGRGPDPWRRRPGARPGADGDRAMTATPGSSCRAASRTTRCRAPTCCRTSRSRSKKCRARPIRSASRASASPARSARRRRSSTRSSIALRPLGIDHIDMPATPQRVWQAIGRTLEALDRDRLD